MAGRHGHAAGSRRLRGDFSVRGWLEDLAFVTAHEIGDQPFWMAGFGLGGAMALRLAADRPTASRA